MEDLLTERYGREIKIFEKIRRLPVKKVVVEKVVGESPQHGQPELRAEDLCIGKTASSVDSLPLNDMPSAPAGGSEFAQTKVEAPLELGEGDELKKRVEIKEIRRVKIEFTADERVASKIARAKEVLRHKFPKGRLEDIIDQALEDMLNKRDPQRKKEPQPKKAETNSESTSEAQAKKQSQSRYIPNELRQKIWRRDQGQCTYQANGKRCGEKGGIQVDHVAPFQTLTLF